MAALDAGAAELLAKIKSSFNQALANQRGNDPLRPIGEVYFFDYIDSPVQTAIAFVHMGVRFIGVTVQMVDDLTKLASHVASVPAIQEELEVSHVSPSTVATMIAYLSCAFVIGHEYTHHYFGDLGSSESTAFDEHEERGDGGVEQQARELNADGYSSWLVLNQLLNAESRAHWTSVLGLSGRARGDVDRILTSIALWWAPRRIALLPCQPRVAHRTAASLTRRCLSGSRSS